MARFFHFASILDSIMDEESSSSSEGEEQKCEVDQAGKRLLDACRDGNLHAVKHLITKENVNSIVNGETPLISACSCNRLNVVKYLIEAGADVLKHGQDLRGNYYPLSTACKYGSPALVRFLLYSGADKGVNKSSYGNRPIHEACWNRRDRDGEMVKMLLRAGAEVNSRGSHGKTPLIAAVTSLIGFHRSKNPRQLKQIEVLLEAGADPDLCNMDGDRPLSLSIQSPHIFRLLVEYGANINTIGRNGEPLYNYFMINVKCVEALLEYDAGVDISCAHGCCPYELHMCCYVRYRREGVMAQVKCFEKHLIKMDIAGLYFGKGLPFVVRPRYEFFSYKGKLSERFRNKCRAELALMSAFKINHTTTYLDVLYQRRGALLRVDYLNVPMCRANFPIYGGLIHSRYVRGRKKLTLVDQCMEFFKLTELPDLPTLCVATILSYLSVWDLKNVVSAHMPQKNEEDIRSRLLGLSGSNDSCASTEEKLEPVADGGSSKRKSLAGDENTSSESKRSRLLVDTSADASSAGSASIGLEQIEHMVGSGTASNGLAPTPLVDVGITWIRANPGPSADRGSVSNEPKPGPSNA